MTVPFKARPVVVAVPEPTENVDPPLLKNTPLYIWLPLKLPMVPLLVTDIAKLSVPEVEVTVVPEPMVDAPVTVRALASKFNAAVPEVVSVPPTARLPSTVTAPAVLIKRLL